MKELIPVERIENKILLIRGQELTNLRSQIATSKLSKARNKMNNHGEYNATSA